MRSLHCLTLKHDFEISAGHVPVLERNFVVVFAMKRGCVNGEKPFDCLAEYKKYIYKQYLIGLLFGFRPEMFRGAEIFPNSMNFLFRIPCMGHDLRKKGTWSLKRIKAIQND